MNLRSCNRINLRSGNKTFLRASLSCHPRRLVSVCKTAEGKSKYLLDYGAQIGKVWIGRKSLVPERLLARFTEEEAKRHKSRQQIIVAKRLGSLEGTKFLVKFDDSEERKWILESEASPELFTSFRAYDELRTFARDRYRSSDTVIKQKCNDLFAFHTRRIVKLIQKDKEGHHLPDILVLDDSSLRTTAALHSTLDDLYGGKLDSYVHIPNCSDSYHAMKVTRDACVYPTYLLNFIRYTRLKFGAIWFDFMCTLNGNTNVRPEVDLEVAFQRQLFRDKSLLAITFSKREKRAEGESTEDKILKSVESRAKRHGYQLKLLTTVSYSMVFMMFEVRKSVTNWWDANRK